MNLTVDDSVIFICNISQDTSERKKSPKKHKRSSVAAGMEDKSGKTSRQPRKQSARKPAKNSPLNEAIVDDDDPDPSYDANRDELEENDEEDGVDYLSKKKKASTRPRKKSVAKNGKTSEKRKKTNDDLENITKEPPKKFSHSSRRKKRCGKLIGPYFFNCCFYDYILYAYCESIFHFHSGQGSAG